MFLWRRDLDKLSLFCSICRFYSFKSQFFLNIQQYKHFEHIICNMSSVQSSVYTEKKNIKKILVALNNITSDMKNYVEDLEEFVDENGHLIATINIANETLSKQVKKLGMVTQKIIDTSKIIRNEKPLSNVELIESLSTVTEQLTDQMNTIDSEHN